MRLSLIVLLSAILPGACSTTSVQMQSPATGARTVLASPQNNCQATTRGQWYLLFGALPINKVDLSLQETGKTYRVKEESKWYDVLIDIFGGAILTLTRKTITVDSCDERLMVVSQDELETERKKELQAALDKYATETPTLPEEAIFILSSGDSIRGKILEFDSDTITIAVRSTVEQGPQVDSVNAASIILRDGKTVVGEVIGQDNQSISLKVGGRTVVIQKERIKRISYQRASTEKEGKPETQVEEVVLPRAQIKRIVLNRPPNGAVN